LPDYAAAPTVFVISDSAGETGDSVVRAAAVQFSPLPVDVRRMPYLQDRLGIDQVIEAARASEGIIVFTIVIPELKEYLILQAVKYRIAYSDLLGPIIGALETALDQKPRHEPGMLHQLNEDYFKRVEAIEFAVRYDDARDTSGVLKADIVLVGVSRTSKTPLSMYLAHKKFKVANVPLVPELKPPDELFKVSNRKIVGLIIKTDKLNEIRIERLKALGLSSTAAYAQMERIELELAYAEGIMNRLGCRIIDVSNKAVEETASLIEELFRTGR
jgi:regulator of PEP synthase PpsR (kinase-PPPase family)